MPQAIVPIVEAIGYALISNGVAAGITIFGAASLIATGAPLMSVAIRSRYVAG
jgi:hypothetical protein